MKLKTNAVSTKWKLFFSLIIACSSVILVYAGSNYTGTPYFGEGNPIGFAETIQHEYHDWGEIEVVAHEVDFGTNPSAERMKPGEWVKYTLSIPDSMIDDLPESPNDPTAQYARLFYPAIYASTDCADNQVGRIDFTIDGDRNQFAYVETSTAGYTWKISMNGRYNQSYLSFDPRDYNANDEVVLKVRSSGECAVYLDWFEFRSPAPQPAHTGN